jgi:hypothetical protein
VRNLSNAKKNVTGEAADNPFGRAPSCRRAGIIVRLVWASSWRASSQATVRAFTQRPAVWGKSVIGVALSLFLVAGGLVRSYAQAQVIQPPGNRKIIRPQSHIRFGVPDNNYENAPVVITSCGVVFTNHPGAEHTIYIAKLTLLNRRGALVKNVNVDFQFISFSPRFQSDSIIGGTTSFDTGDLQSYELRELALRVDDDPPREDTDTDGMMCGIGSVELLSGQVIRYPPPLHL